MKLFMFQIEAKLLCFDIELSLLLTDSVLQPTDTYR